MTETKKANLLAWAIFFYLTMTIFYKAFAGIGMLLFVILAFYVSKDSYKVVLKNKLQIFFILFIGSILISNIYNGGGNYSKLKYYIVPILFSAAFFQFGHLITLKWKRRILFWTLTLSAISSFIGLITLFSKFNILKFEVDHYPRNQGALMGGSMYYSYPIAIISSLTLSLIVHYKRFKSYIDFKVLLITLIINLIGLYYAYTRGSLLAFIASLPFIFYYTNKKIFTASFLLGLLLAGSLSYVIFNKIDLNFYRFNQKESSDSYRISLFKTAFHLYKEKPLLGYGLRNYGNECERIQEQHDIKPRHCAEHSHNQLLDAMSMMGTIGLITYLLFFGYWLLTYLLNFNLINLIALPSFITYLTITITDTPLYIGPVTSILFIMYGMLFIRKKT
ncbi:O-antigen ligase family protein [Halobacteriovorax sp. YZS-1-1]|uniref:O-antigen ligase family protein n=1 Tax=unclassified Halobacteriovorax TaxID=2639665 RepID=UPI00399AE141